MNRYPPLKSLVVFDAAMRSNSFSIAAEELYVTPGAVGQQIQKLEDWLGVLLFTRQVRHVQPTIDGLLYWKRLQPALAQILDASRTLQSTRSKGVWISMPPTFAAKWFMRRMAHFLTLHPEVELHLDSSSAPVNFEREPVDLAIRYFDGNDPHLESTLLFQDEARVYCSPGYASMKPLIQLDDLTNSTLLHTTLQPYWKEWLHQFSHMNDQQIIEISGIHFDQALMAIDASKQGQGLVLTSPLLTEEEIADRTLIEPFACRLTLSNGYYLVHPRRSFLRPGAQAFKAWLINKASAYSQEGLIS